MKTKLFFVTLLTLGFIGFSVQTEAGSSAWLAEVIEEGKGIDWDSYIQARTIATDSAGTPYIVYGGSRLYLARYNGTEWEHEIVDPELGAGSCASIAVDTNDHVHIVYLGSDDPHYPNLKYATNASGTWVIEVLDEASQGVFEGTSIAVDGSGGVHISCRRYVVMQGGFFLLYLTNASGSWICETIPDSELSTYVDGQATSLVLDSQGYVHISSNLPDAESDSDANPAYISNVSGSWMWEVIDGDINCSDDFAPSIAIDSADVVHVSYGKQGTTLADYELIHASNAGGVWNRETACSVNARVTITSVGVDSSDNVRIFFRSGSSLLNVARSSGGWWSTPYEIDATIIACESSALSMVLDATDRPHVSYQHCSSDDYRHRWFEYATHSGQWVSEEVAYDPARGRQADMAMDSSGGVHTIYCADDNLKHATNASGQWITEVVDVDVPPSASNYDSQVAAVTVDPSDNVHIGYVGSGMLKHAYNSGGSWVIETVDNPGACGSVDISVDTTGFVHLSYNDLTNCLVKYASNKSGEWVRETIGSYGDEESETGISIDSSGHAHVVYYCDSYYPIYNIDATIYDHTLEMRRAHNSSGVWESEVLRRDSFSSYSTANTAYVSSGIDSSDSLHVVYSDDGALRYAKTYGSGRWMKTILRDSGGDHCSLTIDTFDRIHISSGSVAYTTNRSGEWETRIISDPSNERGLGTCIGVSTSNQVHVGYYNSLARSLVVRDLAVDFAASDVRGDNPLSVTFSDLSPGMISSWYWDFGDGGTSPEQNPTHIYSEHGDYTVALTVTGPNGSYTQTKQNYVHVLNHLCTCDLVPDSTTVVKGETLGFDVSVTNNSGGSGTVLLGTKVTMPDGSRTGFVWGPLDVSLHSGQTKSGHKTHTVPVGFDLGIYTYHGYVGKYGTIYDECQFDFEVVP